MQCCSLPYAFTGEELCEADPRLQRLTAVDRRLLRMLATDLNGGIGATEDAKWQRLYNCIIACSLPLYNPPNGQ
jgi:hypothetical protein